MSLPETDIVDWRSAVFSLYADLRRSPEPADAHACWREGREALFRHHPQSPIAEVVGRETWAFDCNPYDPDWRFVVALSRQVGDFVEIDLGADGLIRLRPFATTEGLEAALGRELTVYWIEGYGGGVFLPFGDATNGRETYGGGRYVLDTIKGADLGMSDGRLIVDFNFAYNPSCSYSPQWTCPLAPDANQLSVRVPAGERFVSA